MLLESGAAQCWTASGGQLHPFSHHGVRKEKCFQLRILNLWASHVAWHSDNDELCGLRGESKLIVLLSLGSSAGFMWKPQSCLGGATYLCTGFILPTAQPGFVGRRCFFVRGLFYRWFGICWFAGHRAPGSLGTAGWIAAQDTFLARLSVLLFSSLLGSFGGEIIVPGVELSVCQQVIAW